MNAQQLSSLKNERPLTMLTCYDATTAALLEAAEVDILLVGDSCANVFLGADTTRKMMIDRLAYHVEAVRNGAPESHILADIDYTSSLNPQSALKAAKQLLLSGADSVKLEGWHPEILNLYKKEGIPFSGHLGLLPQTAENFRVQGRSQTDADLMIEQLLLIEKAGAFITVVECIPSELGKQLTDISTIPIIGIGAGNDCDGQVLVINDMLGLTENTAKFVRRYCDLSSIIKKAACEYVSDVKERSFPNEKESYR